MTPELAAWRLFVTSAILLFMILLIKQRHTMDELRQEIRILKNLLLSKNIIDSDVSNILKSDGTKTN